MGNRQGKLLDRAEDQLEAERNVGFTAQSLHREFREEWPSENSPKQPGSTADSNESAGHTNKAAHTSTEASTPTLPLLNRPLVFHWPHGGNQVYLYTSIDNWTEGHRMNRSREDFMAIIEGPPGIHTYKFIMDGQWHCAPEQPHVQEEEGLYSNYIQVNRASMESLQSEGYEKDPFLTPTHQDDHLYRDRDGPPLAPPHLLRDMNEAERLLRPTRADGHFEKPSTVAINHLFFTAIPGSTWDVWLGEKPPPHEPLPVSRDVMHSPSGGKCETNVFALTSRYRDKHYTTVYYRPGAETPDLGPDPGDVNEEPIPGEDAEHAHVEGRRTQPQPITRTRNCFGPPHFDLAGRSSPRTPTPVVRGSPTPGGGYLTPPTLKPDPLELPQGWLPPDGPDRPPLWPGFDHRHASPHFTDKY